MVLTVWYAHRTYRQLTKMIIKLVYIYMCMCMCPRVLSNAHTVDS